MLYGAMDELSLGDPWQLNTDVGPVISDAARSEIQAYVDTAEQQNRVLKKLKALGSGHFVAPTVVKVSGIKDLEREVFGPVLHITTFQAGDIGRIVDDINESGYGLTFGLHTRIDDRVEKITTSLNVGNMYVNRNQIGAVVGTQPFGGENLSGTGPKAGGAHYLKRFSMVGRPAEKEPLDGVSRIAMDTLVEPNLIQEILNNMSHKRRVITSSYLPGPTGESNKLSVFPIGRVLCLGPTPELAMQQSEAARAIGCQTLIVCPDAEQKFSDGSEAASVDGFLDRTSLSKLEGFSAVICASQEDDLRGIRKALANRSGSLIPLISENNIAERCVIERHVCIDTTAAGGNVSLLASMG